MQAPGRIGPEGQCRRLRIVRRGSRKASPVRRLAVRRPPGLIALNATVRFGKPLPLPGQAVFLCPDTGYPWRRDFSENPVNLDGDRVNGTWFSLCDFTSHPESHACDRSTRPAGAGLKDRAGMDQIGFEDFQVDIRLGPCCGPTVPGGAQNPRSNSGSISAPAPPANPRPS